MAGLIPSVLLQAWCLGVIWLVWHFRLRRSTQLPPPGLMLFIGFHSVALLFAAGMAAEESRNWARWVRLPRTTTVEQMGLLENQQQALVIARASEGFLIEYDGDDGHAWADASMSLRLEGGTAKLEPVIPSERLGWHSSYSTVSRSRSWLEKGDPLVAAVTIRHGTALGGQHVIWGEPHLIYRGGIETFMAEANARSRRLLPKVVTWAALLGAVLAAVLPLASVLRLDWNRAISGEGHVSGQAPPLVGDGSVERQKESFWERFLVRSPSLLVAHVFAAVLAALLVLLTVVVGHSVTGARDVEKPHLLESVSPEAPEARGGQDVQLGKKGR